MLLTIKPFKYFFLIIKHFNQMKKQILIFVTAFVTVAFVSCSKEKIETKQPNTPEEIATGRIPDGPAISGKGLLGRFEFNGDLKDATGKLPDGVSSVIRVSYTTDRKGQANKAVRFNGAYGVDIKDVPCTPDAASISVWIKHDTLPNPGWLSSVFSNYGFIIQQSYNFFQASYYTGFLGVPPSVFSSTGTDKTWHHMAATRDNNELKFYIDGVFIGSAPTPAGAGPYPALDKYFLGYALGTFWKGSLDDLRFYSRILSASEINTLANN
jgi:hypothetical protein